jgi:AcrR family transcriptional regulator
VIHEAFIYSDEDEYATVLAPFLSEAVVAGQRAIAVTSADRIRLLREALGADQGEVSFIDADEWYRRPGAALEAWRAEFDAYSDVEPLCAIGEVPFAGDSAAAMHWTRYESLFNRAFAGRAAWVVCPYDTRRLPDEIVSGARQTHPIVSTGAGRAASRDHFAGHELGAGLSPTVARVAPRLDPSTTVTAGGDPHDVRRAVGWPARFAGLSANVIEDLILAVREVAATHTTASVQTGSAGGEWFCEVAASGGPPFDENALGVLIGRLICDRVEVDLGPAGIVRFVFGAPKARPRDRILSACTELFAENGVRATGINAIISRAGVAKGTFYAHFQSKNDLVIAWLQGSPVRWFDGVRTELEARTSSPVERLTLLFDVIGEWLAADEFHGCQATNTALEARLADPARSVLAELDSEIEAYLSSTARAAGLPDPDGTASQLLVLVSGTITTAVTRKSGDHVAAARRAAARLVG